MDTLENSSTESQTVAPVESADTSAELAQPADSQSGEPATEAERPKAEPKPDPIQRRFNELTYQRHEADRRANEAITFAQQQALRMQEMQRQLDQFEALRSMPDPSQFTTPEEYARAHWQQQQQRQQVEQANFQRQQQEQQIMLRAQQEQAQRAAYVGAQSDVLIAEGSAKYPDFEKVISDPKLPGFMGAHPAVLQTFFGSEKKAEIAYYLGKNPTEAHKLAAMQPVQQIAELGRIEARLSRAAISNATPNPLSAVPGQATPRGASLENLSTADFIKRRNEQERRRMGGR